MGYCRYWLAEHHGSPGLAGTTPEVLVARVAAATSTIRVGSGGVLLSHYSALKVAETFRVLGALFPDRIDLGIGRADGASPTTAAALGDGVADVSLPFGQKLTDLLGCFDLERDGADVPSVWLLASSSDGAGTAAATGLPLCFAHFISTGFGPQIVARYRQTFQPSATLKSPVVSVAVSVICADTDAEAERLATSVDVWRLSSENGRGPVPTVEEAQTRPLSALDKAKIAQKRKGLVVGGPERVSASLKALALSFGVDELVILTVCHDPRTRLYSYELLGDVLGLRPRAGHRRQFCHDSL